MSTVDKALHWIYIIVINSLFFAVADKFQHINSLCECLRGRWSGLGCEVQWGLVRYSTCWANWRIYRLYDFLKLFFSQFWYFIHLGAISGSNAWSGVKSPAKWQSKYRTDEWLIHFGIDKLVFLRYWQYFHHLMAVLCIPHWSTLTV